MTEPKAFTITFDEPAETLEALARTLEVARRIRPAEMTPGEAIAIRSTQRMYEQLMEAATEESSAGDAEPAAVPPVVDDAVTEEGEPVEDLIEPLGELGEALMEAGFVNRKALREASDEDLMAVRGVGPAKLRSIREFASA